MKICTGRHCPVQFNPEHPLDSTKCKALEDCVYATTIDLEENNQWLKILLLLLGATFKRESED